MDQKYVDASIAGFQLMHDYLLSKSAPVRKGQVRFYLYYDQDLLADAYRAEYGRTPNHNERESTAVAGRNHSFMNAMKLEEWGARPESVIKIIAHELVHNIQGELSRVRGRSQDHEMPLDGPRWLREGIAEYLAYRAMDAGDVYDYEDLRDPDNRGGVVQQGLGVDKPLSELRTMNEIRRASGNLYQLYLLAGEFLAHHAGEPALLNYYTRMRPGTTWQEVFEAEFGMPVGEFYKLFNDHRAAGFPEVEIHNSAD